MDKDQQQAAIDRWNEYAPMVASVEHAEKEEFFTTAPIGSVVDISGDLYKRSPRGDWIHLEELVSSGNAYSEYQEHDRSPGQYMAVSVAGSEYTVVRVLRLGEGA